MNTTSSTPLKKHVARVVNLADMPTTSGRFDFICDQVAAHLSNDPVFIEHLSRRVNLQLQNPEDVKSFAKSMNVGFKIQQLLETQELQSSPFAPVFIADLKPDKIPAGVCAELDRLTGIKDLSGLIRVDQD
jgi:hypothetical protein